jgi:hypothetical protein
LLARGRDSALDVDDLALLVEEVGLRNDMFGGERRHHLDLVLSKGERALEAVDRRLRFGRVAPRLVGGGLRRGDLAAQRGLARHAKRFLAGAVRTFAGDVLAHALGRQPCGTRLEGFRFRLDLPELRFAFRIVEPDEQLALVDPLARADEKLADGRGIGRGDDLELARGNNLALTASHFVDLREARPDEEKRERDRRGDDDHPRAGHRLAVPDRGSDEWKGSHVTLAPKFRLPARRRDAGSSRGCQLL